MEQKRKRLCESIIEEAVKQDTIQCHPKKEQTKCPSIIIWQFHHCQKNNKHNKIKDEISKEYKPQRDTKQRHPKKKHK